MTETMGSKQVKVVIIVAGLGIIGGIFLHLQNRRHTHNSIPDFPAAPSQASGPVPSANLTPRKAGEAVRASSETNEPQADEEEPNPLLIPRAKIEEYLAIHHRDAASLLAAFHAASDPDHPEQGIDYLKEAATNFPGDPFVQRTILAHDAFPEDRRKWLEAFKTSSPSNSLANYLSARDYFKNGQQDAAMKDLLEASGKGQFTDFAMESYLGAAELSRFSGASTLIATTAGMSAMSADLLPQLSNMKAVVQGIREAQKQYVDSGDNASAQNLSQMGVGLANRLTSGDGGRFISSQLVGIATETIALQALDQNTSYDFLGGKTAGQRLEEIRQQKLDFRALASSFNPAFAAATEAEKDNYTERMKIYGEIAAMRWLQQQHAADPTQTRK